MMSMRRKPDRPAAVLEAHICNDRPTTVEGLPPSRRAGRAARSKRGSSIRTPMKVFREVENIKEGEFEMLGGCHCGAIRYRVEGTPRTHALCHCSDCRRHAGAPMVSWAMFARDAVKIEKGAVKIYHSSEHGRRHFCPDCGTGLFYCNEQVLPGIID